MKRTLGMKQRKLIATLSGKTIKHPVTVGPAKLRTVDFRWAAE